MVCVCGVWCVVCVCVHGVCVCVCVCGVCCVWRVCVCVCCVCVCVCVQVDAALGRVDEVVEDLLLGLKERDIYNCVNVIIVSDHGEGEIRHGGQKLNL